MALAVCGLRHRPRRPTSGCADSQLADGSWFNYYLAVGVKDPRLDTNVCAYVATGVWHHYLVTGDSTCCAAMWPTIERALDFVAAVAASRRLRALVARPRGPARGLRPADRVVLRSTTRCAAGWPAPSSSARSAPTGSWPPAGWATPWPTTPGRSRRRTSSPWTGTTRCSPGLSRATAGRAPDRRRVGRLRDGGPRRALRVDRRLGDRRRDRRVRDGPRRARDGGRGARLLAWAQGLRLADGSYWTGMVYPEQVTFPAMERTTYTSAAMVLAADALLARDAGVRALSRRRAAGRVGPGRAGVLRRRRVRVHRVGTLRGPVLDPSASGAGRTA